MGGVGTVDSGESGQNREGGFPNYLQAFLSITN